MCNIDYMSLYLIIDCTALICYILIHCYIMFMTMADYHTLYGRSCNVSIVN